MLLVTFHNDGTGDQDTGNYEVTVSINTATISRERIKGHKRSDGWRELVRLLAENDGPDDGG